MLAALIPVCLAGEPFGIEARGRAQDTTDPVWRADNGPAARAAAGETAIAVGERAPELVALAEARDTVLPAVDSLLDAYVESGRLAGAVTLVLKDGREVHRAAHGVRDLETGEPLRTDAIFRIASQTKAITSVAAMMLVEEGRIGLDDPVYEHLPAFRSLVVLDDSLGYRAARRAVTIRDLLTHTSGISYGSEPSLAEHYAGAGFDAWYFAASHLPIRDLIRRLPELPIAAQPGERWIYGMNTDVLGAVVEAASGTSLDEFFSTRIFQPLGMTDTHFYLPPEKEHRLAAVHAVIESGAVVRAPERGRIGQGEYVRGPRTTFSGGAGLVSTADDYARFLRMMLNGGELDGVRLLRPETVREMTRNQVGEMYVAPGYGFGLGFEVKLDEGDADGWDVPGRAAVGSFGWGGAYHSTYWVDPEHGIVGIFLTQLIPATGLDVRQRFKHAVYDELMQQ